MGLDIPAEATADDLARAVWVGRGPRAIALLLDAALLVSDVDDLIAARKIEDPHARALAVERVRATHRIHLARMGLA